MLASSLKRSKSEIVGILNHNHGNSTLRGLKELMPMLTTLSL